MNESTDKYSGMARKIDPAKGKLGVLLPGMGAVSSTLIAGVLLVNAGYSKPIGSGKGITRDTLLLRILFPFRPSRIWFLVVGIFMTTIVTRQL